MVRQDRCPGSGEQHKGTLRPPFDTHLAATWAGTAGQGRARGAHVSGCTQANSTAARDGGLKVAGEQFFLPRLSAFGRTPRQWPPATAYCITEEQAQEGPRSPPRTLAPLGPGKRRGMAPQRLGQLTSERWACGKGEDWKAEKAACPPGAGSLSGALLADESHTST